MSACGATELLNCNESIHEKLLSQTHTSDMAITYNCTICMGGSSPELHKL